MFGLIEKHAGRACLLILVGYAWAGLFPFDPRPSNGVRWIDDRDGLQIRDGSVLGPPDRSVVIDPNRSCSFEIRVRPVANHGSSALLAFYDPELPHRILIEQRDERGFWIRRWDAAGIPVIRVRHRFVRGRPTLVTVTSGPALTQVYFDGVHAEASSELRVTMADCSRRFVLGTGATSDTNWDGEFLGLAIYDRQLSPGEVEAHYAIWSSDVPASASAADFVDAAPLALYLFNERSGDRVRDHTSGRRDLVIPGSFQVPIQSFLVAPRWTAILRNDLDWPDIVVNIAGFAPFGFFLSAFVFRIRIRRAVLLVLTSSLAVSLAIEVLQSWLPTRTSSMTDVLTNVLGAGVGLLLYYTFRPRRA